MKVLRRDDYRCRGCARPGDEITLQVCLVRLHGDRLWALTLCPSCQRRAAEVEPGLIKVVEGQNLHGRVPAEVPLESVRHFSHTA
jgi:5-methylcytosine-specific restriction endonuclease McrA